MSKLALGIDVFIVTVEKQSFAAAAMQLNLTRSAVAKTIAKMEDHLQVRLFNRTTRTLRLTDEGQLYYEYCLRALHELQAGKLALDTGRKEVIGRLRVSMPVLFGRYCIAPILTKLSNQHPKLELELHFSDHAVNLIEDGFDLAIRNGPINDSEGLMTRVIGLQRMVLCGSRAYFSKYGYPKTLDEVEKHLGIIYGRANKIHAWQFPIDDGKTLQIKPISRFLFDDLAAIADACEAGLGLAWLPFWLIRERVLDNKLIIILNDVPPLIFKTQALWPQTPHLPLRVRYAIDAIKSAMPGSAEL